MTNCKRENCCRYCLGELPAKRTAFCTDAHKWAWHREYGAIKNWREENREQQAEYMREWAKKNRTANPNWRKGRSPWNKGLTKTDPRVAKNVELAANAQRHLWQNPEYKANQIAKHKGQRTGSANNKWRGGITSENEKIRTSSPEYKKWRLAVYKRDCYTCQDCGKKSTGPRSLVAHHIKSFAEYPLLRFEVSNGITYCRACHVKNDPQMGRYPRRPVNLELLPSLQPAEPKQFCAQSLIVS